jgi:regulatory protein
VEKHGKAFGWGSNNMRADPQLLSNDFDVDPAGTEEDDAGQHCTGVVKWFDVTRGFGFVVADEGDLGDILVHFTVLQDHGRRSLPEGARVECVAVRRQRGFQAREILSIDLTDAVEAPRSRGGDRAALERMGLRYVERYATTRGRLTAYLQRKIRERGWAEEVSADPAALAEKLAELGYIDDRAFAESRASAMGRRGLGARRVGEALRFAGIEAEDAEAVAPLIEDDRIASALAFARRKRIGPHAREVPDRAALEKQVGAMVRAGHSPSLAWKIARMEPGTDAEALLAET